MAKRRRRSAQDRRAEIARHRRELLRSQSPRLHVLAILVLTGAFGFLVSWGLLEIGLLALWLRYPLAVALAYGAFLLQLRIWLAYQRRHRARREDRESDAGDLSDLLDPNLLDVSGSVGRGVEVAGRFAGAGGRFGGAGASGSYQGAMPLPMMDTGVASAQMAGHASSGGTKGIGGLFELAAVDDVPLAVVLAVLAAVLSLLLAAGYLVWTAPALLSEILVDGLVVAALSHRLKTIEGPTWIRSVVRRTWFPATGVALALGGTGYLLQRLDPTIDSIGDVARLFGLG